MEKSLYGLFSFVVLLFVIIGLTVPVSGLWLSIKHQQFRLCSFVLLLIDQQKISKTKWDKINSLLI